MMSKSTNYYTKMQQEHKLFFDNNQAYKKHVDSVSELFSLSGSDKLMNELLPVAFTGQYQRKGSIVLFGINPGYVQEFNDWEEKQHGKTWEDYCKYRNVFYLDRKKNNHPSKYYIILYKLFSKIFDDNSESLWDFYQNNLINLNLIPYHSKGISLPSKFSEKQLTYLKESYFSQLDFIEPFQPKLFLFNGNPWYKFLIENHIITNFEKIQITPKFNIYFFKISSTPAVLFDKFFTSHFFGLTDHHRTQIIPQIINARIK